MKLTYPIVNRKGMSLLEALVALGITSIIMVGIFTMAEVLIKSNARQGLVQTRNDIIIKIRINSLNFDYLKVSAGITKSLGSAGLVPDIDTANDITHFDMLAKCMPDMSGGSASGCDKTTMDVSLKGNQFYLAGSLSVDPNKTIAGTDVFYRANGIRCTPDEAASANSCPLFAKVWFEPYCLNYALICNKAMSLAVRYAVGTRSDYTSPGLNLMEGEVYIPLQKGIQLSRLLDQNDAPIAINSYGLFAVPKYYGSQSISGFRFEAMVSNSTGLVSMKLQQRAITGPAAKNYGENLVPAALETANWQDVVTPNNNAAGAWSINLTNARPNQIFNFGTQETVTSGSRIPVTALAIGSADPTDPIFHWTKNTSTQQFQSPQFKSGLYQYRIVAQDIMGNMTESANYFTVRIIGAPEFLFANEFFNQERDCSAAPINYNILVGDDEYLSDTTIKLNGTNLGVPQANSDRGSYTVPFALNSSAGTYILQIDLKNAFSDVPLENFIIAKTSATRSIVLKEYQPQFATLANNPSKIRINITGDVIATYVTGNCCSQNPVINWNYPAAAAFGGVALLSGPANSTFNCSAIGNVRTCNSNISVTGIKEGPDGLPPADIMATLILPGTVNPACELPNASSYTQSKYIPVVKNPSISFYLTESLWLTAPGGNISSQIPRVYVRADFAPEETVAVQVVKASDSSVVCTVQFAGASVPGAAIDKYCDIPAGFSGDLLLQEDPAYADKIQSALDNPTVLTYKASLMDSLVHRTCSANLTDIPDQAPTYVVPSPQAMEDSPWGYVLDSSGNKIQNSKNDTGLWVAGASKILRCYDNWSTYSSGSTSQDYYSVYKYNTEDRIPINGIIRNASIGTMGTPVKYANFVFPSNPPLLVDTGAKNIPYVYAVYQDNSTAPKVAWRYKDSTSGGSAHSSPQPWENVTSQVCSGVGTLSKVKLLRSLMSVQSNTGNIIMKATNGLYTDTPTGAIHSYVLMCAYGRWHPSDSNAVTWSN